MAQIKRRTTARGETRHDVRVRIGARVVTRTFKRRRDADPYATTLDADRLRGIAIDPHADRVKFAVYAEGWLTRPRPGGDDPPKNPSYQRFSLSSPNGT